MFLKIFKVFREGATHFFKQVNIGDSRKCGAYSEDDSFHSQNSVHSILELQTF
jgi:hypothetical protein